MTFSRLTGISCLPLTLTLLLIGLPETLRGDLDKEDIRKKQEGEAKPSLNDANGEDFYRNLARKGEKNLREINELLENIQKDLSRKNTGGETQTKQRQAVEKLERLIEEIAKASQQSSSSSSSSQQQQQKQQQQKQQQQKQQQQRQEQDKMQANQMKPDKQKSQKERNDDQNREHQRLEKPASPEDKSGSLVARLRRNRRWGLLPRKVTEALSSSDKEAPAEYQEIIARYYKRMTEVYDRQR